jgi:hypothetical protein
MQFRNGSISSKVRDLILSREILGEPMSSSAISSVIYGVTGRKIAVSHVIQYLQPFQEAGIIRREKTEGKILWFGSWETPSSGSGNVLFDQLIRHRRIRKTSSELFMDGHYASAIFEACKTLEVMVKEKAREGLTCAT